MTKPSLTEPVRPPWWPWVILTLGVTWTVLIRIPLILNAEDHLDSDLAVDGLTLLDAVRGHWRWHYPGTPHMGILPMFFSYPQALLWGANPIALVSGGTIIWVVVVISTFWLAWRVNGPSVASWAIVPLVFSSLGTIWLSGRITGGHLLTLAWHTLALVGFHASLTRGGPRSAALLGAWCGLGLYLDAMFLFTVIGIALAAFLAWVWTARSKSGVVLAVAFLAGMIIGLAPRGIGRWVDPYDAYSSQFAARFDRSVVTDHAQLLVVECLPRLIAGMGWLEAQRFLGGRSSSLWPSSSDSVAIVMLVGFAVAAVRLAFDAIRGDDPPRRALTGCVLLSATLIVAAFLVNHNISNSDNYRYLIFLLTPWSVGFGLGMDDLSRHGLKGRVTAGLLAGLLAGGMTVAAFRWYGGTRQYLDGRGFPVRREPPQWSELVIMPDRRPSGDSPPSPARSRRFTIPPDVTHVFGGYWDVYRLSYLSERRIAGIPFPTYPNRFPGWSDGLGPGRGKIMILRPSEEPTSALQPAAEKIGGGPARVRSASAIKWHRALATAWKADGRDSAELDHVTIVVP
jgi:hypothetical protein